MKITLFTSDKIRHNYLINLLYKISDKLFVVQECSSITPDIMSSNCIMSPTIKKYFENVNIAQSKLFGKSFINNLKRNIKILPIQAGDLSKYPMDLLLDFLKSDIYIVYGSSYIKGDLSNFLVERRAINIHAGVSPYYRGSDCNFWALYDDNSHLAGSTIQLLSKGLDNGPILYHSMSNINTNPFEYTMSTVKSAFHSLAERIKDNSLFRIDPIVQDNSREIRYSRKNEFNEEIIIKYFKKKINLNNKIFDNSLLNKPFFLNN